MELIKVSTEGLTPPQELALMILLEPYNVEFSHDKNDEPSVKISKGQVETDLLQESAEIIQGALHPRIAFKYKIATKLPIQYNIIPSSIRRRFLRFSEADFEFSPHLRNEVARERLVEALGRFSKIQVKQEEDEKKHDGIINRKGLLITHDVDTEKGLERTLVLKEVEEKLGLKSLWFIPSDEYPLNRRIVHELRDEAIGSHDLKHDGRLIGIRNQEKLVTRLRASRQKLEEVFGKPVTYFRSPLLQFSEEILTGLQQAGYTHDFSLPSWEPVHPSTMSGFGIEAVRPFSLHGMREIPLTMLQDHQLLYVKGFSIKEAVEFWKKQYELIWSFGGKAVLLIHPDYAFASDPDTYRQLLQSIVETEEKYVVAS